jgi:hypothetical protein
MSPSGDADTPTHHQILPASPALTGNEKRTVAHFAFRCFDVLTLLLLHSRCSIIIIITLFAQAHYFLIGIIIHEADLSLVAVDARVSPFGLYYYVGLLLPPSQQSQRRNLCTNLLQLALLPSPHSTSFLFFTFTHLQSSTSSAHQSTEVLACAIDWTLSPSKLRNVESNFTARHLLFDPRLPW